MSGAEGQTKSVRAEEEVLLRAGGGDGRVMGVRVGHTHQDAVTGIVHLPQEAAALLHEEEGPRNEPAVARGSRSNLAVAEAASLVSSGAARSIS